MLITYIHHSCFSVETEQSVFLFDYYKGNIPTFPKEKHLFVFSSHSHQDHFNHDIFKLLNDYPQITYILSKDIHVRRSFFTEPDGFENAKKHIITIGKNESLSLPAFTLETFRSTDKGVAFLITEKGRTLYHAGDLNWWLWNEDTPEEQQKMTKNFKDEIRKLGGRKIDFAFLVLDPRQEEEFYSLGFDFFMRNTDTAHAFPMHFWRDYSVLGKFKASEEAIPYRDKIMEITDEGQTFLIDDESERILP